MHINYGLSTDFAVARSRWLPLRTNEPVLLRKSVVIVDQPQRKPVRIKLHFLLMRPFTIVMRERWSRRARRLACPAEQSSVALAFGRRKACVVRTLLSARPCRKAFHPGVVVVSESSNACQAPLGCLPHRTTYLALVVWGLPLLSLAVRSGRWGRRVGVFGEVGFVLGGRRN